MSAALPLLLTAAWQVAPPPLPDPQAASPDPNAPPAIEEVAARPPVMPVPVKQMLDAAIASGNEGEINTVAKYARGAAPDAADEIEGLVRAWRERRTAAQRQRLAEAGPFDLWKGKVDLGGTRTTGISDTLGISAGVLLNREGAKWRHQLRGRVDYQAADGETVRDAFLLSYEPRFQVSDAAFTYGLAQYDSDSFLGFDSRFSASGGVGYRLAGPGPLNIDVDAGPTYRETHFTDGTQDGRVGGRGSLNVRWQLLEGVNFSNNSALVVDGNNNSFANTAALDTRLIGSLSARLSYNLQYESMPPIGRETTGTISRATLVYDF